ncbi:MAG: efflux RND transporter periplasmic adaptor subunit [Desulfitobacteriaceae bacterium]
MNKKLVTITALGIVLLGGGFWAYKNFAAKPAAASLITANAQTGDVRKVITATGTVNFPKAIPLSFQQAGKLVSLNVNPGDVVKQGQVLAQLDTTNLVLSVNQQQANLASTQAKLQQTLDSSNSNTLAAVSKAQAEVANAQQALMAAQQNADPGYLANQVNLAKQNLLTASNNLVAAQAKAQQSGSSSGVQTAQTALTQAQTALANAVYAQDSGAAQTLAQAQAAYDAAQADLAQAQAQAQKQQQGSQSTDVLQSQASVTQVQAQLSTAQTNLANATLTAPVDGVITTVAVQNYQSVGGNTAVMTLAAGSNLLQVDVSVDQADIDQVKVGQKADITLDSHPDQHISGTVSQVALQGTTVQNVTTFNVTVQVDPSNTFLKAGMNANVSIILAEVKGVLTVPSEAIRGTGNRKGVLVPGAAPDGSNGAGNASQKDKTAKQPTQGGTQGQASGNNFGLSGVDAHFVPVETGLDDGTNVEIKSGLTDGQEIVLGVRSASTPKATTGFGPGGNNNGNNNPGRAMGEVKRATNGR